MLDQGGASTRAERLGQDGEPVAPIEVSRLEAEALEDYPGEFQLAPGVVISVTRDGNRLLVQLTGQPAIEVYPDGVDRFVYTVVDAAIEFSRDDAGRVISLTLHQNGAVMPALRIEGN
jgi:hypothetical protein